jgi:hypothetical protein
MNHNIITQLNLETACTDLKHQGHTVRDISKILTERAHVTISASAVFRYLKETEMKQIVQPELKQEIPIDMNQVKQEAEPQKPKVLVLIPYPRVNPHVSTHKPKNKILILTPSSDDDRFFW